MYSASPPLQQHYTSSIDRRRPSGTMDSSPQQPQQAWLQSTMIQQHQQPQDTGLNYMVHHGYPVVPKPTGTAPSHYHPQQYQHHPANINSKQQTANRAVIPSKRAAQNRAAQKAFRQRREQYVKDLEKKSKEMDQWLQDRDSVMNENRRLKTMVHQLQSRIASLTGEPIPSTPPASLQEEQQHTSPSPLPPSSPPQMSSSPTFSIRRTSYGPSLSPTTSSIPPVPLTTTVNGRSISASPPQLPRQATTLPPSPSVHRPIHPTSSSSSASSPTTPSHSLLPIPLRPHSFVPSKEDDLPIPSPSPPSFPVVAPAGQLASTLPDTRPTMFELDLDPFFDDDFGGFPRMDDQLDFVGHPNNNSGQVLDDLFAMLQTRQRPQIPLQPTSSNGDDVPYYLMDPVVSNHSSG